MKLGQKVLLLFGVVSIGILLLVGGFLYSWLRQEKFSSIYEGLQNQLSHVDFALTGFLKGVEWDLEALASDDRVRDRDDETFTNFTNADPDTFQYAVAQAEQSIVDLFNRYRNTHDFVNSVYMGRKNGAFVRSHRRAKATAYDPRNRPWYALAEQHPGKVMRTAPYKSVTTPDVNIGFVTALIDNSGEVYGVVGIDITLKNLADYIERIKVGHGGWALMTDADGTILAARDLSAHLKNIREFDADVADAMLRDLSGVKRFSDDDEDRYLFFRTSRKLGWKLAFIFPAKEIERQVQGLVLKVMLALFTALALLSGLTLAGLQRFILRPIKQLDSGTDHIAKTGDLTHRIDVQSDDEIGNLARDFNLMMGSIRKTEAALRDSEEELRRHRDHLEERVEERTAELKNSEKRMAQIIDFLPDPTFVVGNNGRTLAWNKAMVKLTGIKAAAMLGKSDFEYALPFYGQRRPILVDMVQNWQEVYEEKYLSITKNGEILTSESYHPDMGAGGIYLSATAGLLYDASGEVTGAIESLRDITDRKEMEEALVQAKTAAVEANRAKGDFLANMSHEIRTPMNAVLGMTYLALKTDLTPKQLDCLNKIQSSANALLGIINDILDFSKIEAGKLHMESVDFNLDEVFDGLADLVTVKAQEKDELEVLFDIAPNVPRALVGDPLRLGQVLVNLVGNAVKFTESGHIVVSAQLDRQEADRIVLKFAVKDTGIGLRREQTGRLFRSFTQADPSTTREYGGTGLGLAICKRLVGLMEGRIWVDSKFGAGSTFSFTATFGSGNKRDQPQHVPPPDLRGLRVLVVDDNPTSREILLDMLETFTFQVALAASGEEGLAEVERASAERPFDLIVMDWKMPGLDGIETSKRIKNHRHLSNIPAIVLITAYGREEVMKKAESAGLDGFLLKPVSPSVMFDTIMQAFDQNAPGTPKETGAANDTVPPATTLKGARILVVEDNEINRQVAQGILSGCGIRVSMAAHGKEAIEALKRERFDAVLMDVQMPVMDGYTATRKIRSRTEYAQLPIIAMTAHAMAGDRQKSLDAGMNDHVTKPIDPDKLLATLACWIRLEEAPSGEDKPPASGITEGQPAAVPPAQLEAFPDELPGFDLKEGLHRLQGNRELYRKLLLKFAESHEESMAKIRAGVNRGQVEEAQRKVHTLKGLAGNLSAHALQAAAADVDHLLKKGVGVGNEYQDSLIQALEAMETALKQATQSARMLTPGEKKSAGNQSGKDAAVIPTALAREAAERLHSAAEMGDVAELISIAKSITARCAGFAPHQAAIIRLVDDFDFEGILEIAKQLKNN